MAHPHDGPKNGNVNVWVDGNFALFVLADISNEDISSALKEAFDGADLNHWGFWLADDFSTAPRYIQYQDEDGEHTRIEGGGTEAPIAESWQSPFKGKTVEDAAAFLRSAPNDLSIDFHHFAVLDADNLKRRWIKIYRIGDEDLMGEKLDSLLFTIESSLLFLGGLKSGIWEDYREDRNEDDGPVY